MRSRLGDLQRFVEELAAPGQIDTFVLLGMGGSSLAPEVIRRTFGAESFHVLDTTHPAAIRRLAESLDLDATLFVAASKSGRRWRRARHLDFFWERAGKRGESSPRSPIPARSSSSSPGSAASSASFDGEPTIGGRYSALSVFGLVPAALMGIDLERLLERVEETVEACHGEEGNPGLELGLELGNGWHDGRDKVTINPNPGGFGLWAEQLLAESTGKEGKGLIPAPERVARGARTARRPRCGCRRPVRARRRSSSAGSSRPPSPARSSASTRSTSRTCRRRRTRRTRCCAGGRAGRRAARLARRAVRAGPAGRLRGGAGVHRPRARGRAGAAASRAPARNRLRRDARPRPALPALDRPAAQGRAEHRALRPGRRRRRRRAADPGPRLRLPAADPARRRQATSPRSRSAAAESSESDWRTSSATRNGRPRPDGRRT